MTAADARSELIGHRAKQHMFPDITITCDTRVLHPSWHQISRSLPQSLFSRSCSRPLELPSRRRHCFGCCSPSSAFSPRFADATTHHTTPQAILPCLPADDGHFQHGTPLTHHMERSVLDFAAVHRCCGLCARDSSPAA